MPTTRTRRIVRRAVMALAVVVLLDWYFASYLGWMWLAGSGVIKPGMWRPACDVLYAPIDLYMESELPGSGWLFEVSVEAYREGTEHR